MKQEDIGKIWEWCGVDWLESRREESTGSLILEPPKLTLDNLFKYAVPKLLKVKNIWDKGSDGLWFSLELISGSGEFVVEVRTWNNHLVYTTPPDEIGTDPAEALASAILKVIENE